MGSAQTLAQYWHRALLRSPKEQAVLFPPASPSVAAGRGAGRRPRVGGGGLASVGPAQRRTAQTRPGPGRSDSRRGRGRSRRVEPPPGGEGGPHSLCSASPLSAGGARRRGVWGEFVGPPLHRCPGRKVSRGGRRAPCGHRRAAGRVGPRVAARRARAGPRRAVLPPPGRRGRAGGLRRPSPAGGTRLGEGTTAALSLLPEGWPSEMLSGRNPGVIPRGPASRFWGRHQHLCPCGEHQREDAPSSLELSFPGFLLGNPPADPSLWPAGRGRLVVRID